MPSKKRLDYKGIPCAEGGEIALSIYPPGNWFDYPTFVCFVGGSGVGQAKTLKLAERILLRKAKEYLQSKIDSMLREAIHYQGELANLKLDKKKEIEIP